MGVTEEWRPVVGHEGAYEVSSLGRVRSVDRILVQDYGWKGRREQKVARRMRGCILRLQPTKSGHLSVRFRDRTRLVHHLVLEAFVGPRPPGTEGLHGDDVPNHNALDNLSWGTRQQNVDDAARNGRRPLGEKVHSAKLKAADIPAIRRRLRSESGASIARDYGVNKASIYQIRDGVSWSHVPQEEC